MKADLEAIERLYGLMRGTEQITGLTRLLRDAQDIAAEYSKPCATLGTAAELLEAGDELDGRILAECRQELQEIKIAIAAVIAHRNGIFVPKQTDGEEAHPFVGFYLMLLSKKPDASIRIAAEQYYHFRMSGQERGALSKEHHGEQAAIESLRRKFQYQWDKHRGKR